MVTRSLVSLNNAGLSADCSNEQSIVGTHYT